RRHTRWPRDWSSDVCSSDLSRASSASRPERRRRNSARRAADKTARSLDQIEESQRLAGERVSLLDIRKVRGIEHDELGAADAIRSEERRVGKECRARRSEYR